MSSEKASCWTGIVAIAGCALGCAEADAPGLAGRDVEPSAEVAQPITRASFLITEGVPIQNSPTTAHWNFFSWSVNARLGGDERAFLSSDPSGSGPIIVDNGAYVNGREIEGLFGGTFTDPRAHLGESALVAYKAVDAVEVTGDAKENGQWDIRLYDYGYTYAAGRLYLVITK